MKDIPMVGFVPNSAEADRALERHIASYLASRNVPALRRLHIHAHQGRVTLRGRVRSFYEKQLGQQTARRVPGVVELVDAIEVIAGYQQPTAKLRFSIAPAVVRYLAGRKSSRIVGLLLLAASVALPACSDSEVRLPVYPVTGQVKLPSGPATGALVVFHPKNGDLNAPRPNGNVDAQGRFTLTTYEAGDGAPAGEYAVTVELRKLIVEGRDARPGPNVIAPKYSQPSTTILQVRVTEGPNNVPEFRVETGGQNLSAARPVSRFID